ncbi:MAG: phosphoribosyltransferase family protein [Salinivirgaceae bacterium]|nr:phosphoribosyltransferase family protein [Salinivirgaceae bacterium]
MAVLPKNNVTGKVSVDRALLKTPDWEAAKNATDEDAAQRVITRMWNDKKTEAVRALIDGAANVMFVSQPSTTRSNILPFQLAKMLAERLGGEYCAGDQLYDVLHSQQMKHIARMERPFHPRDYMSVDPVIVREKFAGKKIFIVDDLLTTGGSVKDFIRALNDDGVNVTCVVALAGDPRLQVDEKTMAALKTALQTKGIDLPAGELADSLTRTEAGRIILLIRNVRTENGKQKLTRKLQGILDRGPVENIGRDPEQGRHLGPQGKDPGLEPDDERIRPWGVLENGQRELKSQQASQPGPESEEEQKSLPDDLPSLEALWKVEIQKLLKPIQAKARRAEQKAQAVLDRHGNRIHEHDQNKPREPTGLLARKGNYQKRMNTWSETHEHLRIRQLQLRKRVDWLQEYGRERVSSIYKSPAQQIAERLLARDQPELARKLTKARELQYKHKMERIRENMQQRNERSRSNQGFVM